MEPIDQSSFISWVNHPVTVEIFNRLTELEEALAMKLQNREILLDPDSRVICAELLGSKEMLERILNISYEDIKPEEEKDDLKTTQSPWR